MKVTQRFEKCLGVAKVKVREERERRRWRGATLRRSVADIHRRGGRHVSGYLMQGVRSGCFWAR